MDPINPRSNSDPSFLAVASLDARLGYALLRVTLGLNMSLHSYQRYKDLGKFTGGMVRDFAATPLPAWSVQAFAWSVPFVEPIIGVLILFGLGTRWALAVGALFIAALVFGTALRSDFQTLTFQMVYALLFFFLLIYRPVYNQFSLDASWVR